MILAATLTAGAGSQPARLKRILGATTLEAACSPPASGGSQTAPEDERHDILGPGCGLTGNAVSSCSLMGLWQAAAGLPAGGQEAQQLWQQRRVQ